MDDIGKALVMAGQVLMFAFAATIAIFLYNKLTANVDSIMLASDYSNRGDSIVGVESTDYTRMATKAEVIMAILDLKSKAEKFETSNYKVIVDGKEFTYDITSNKIVCSNGNSAEINTDSLRNILTGLVDQPEYTLTYGEDSMVLEYN